MDPVTTTALISGGLNLAGSIFGGKSASKTMTRLRNELAKRKRENTDWYNRAYNEDATQRADAQRAITQAEEIIKKRNEAAAGTAAVMGGSNEAVAAAQSANNSALADVASRIAVAGEERKAQVERDYQARQDALAQQEMELDLQKAQAQAEATKGIFSAAGGIASSLGGLFNKG